MLRQIWVIQCRDKKFFVMADLDHRMRFPCRNHVAHDDSVPGAPTTRPMCSTKGAWAHTRPRAMRHVSSVETENFLS